MWLILTTVGNTDEKVRFYFGNGGVLSYAVHKSGGTKLFRQGMETVVVRENIEELDSVLNAADPVALAAIRATLKAIILEGFENDEPELIPITKKNNDEVN